MNSGHSETFGNKYIPLNLIGSGGMAEVYRCKLSGHEGFEKLIVLKQLLPQFAKDPEIVSNFIDEAKLAALLQHENIAYINDFGEIDGKYFIAMEYLFGKDLHTVIQKAKEQNEPMAPELALLITAKICDAMGYAHDLKDLSNRPLNIIHRDLSPHNIFVTYDGKIKIIDFGIAKAELFDNRTKAGMVKGKVSYMSPEQLSNQGIDLRSDIFSIGILLYEMLSGKRMYTGDTATLIRKCMEGEYRKLEEITPGLPTQTYAIVEKALRKDVDTRYQSCSNMGRDIDDCLFGINPRPSTLKLKAYIRELFDDEYEEEKNRSNQESGDLTELFITDDDNTSFTNFTAAEHTIVYDSDSDEKTRVEPTLPAITVASIINSFKNWLEQKQKPQYSHLKALIAGTLLLLIVLLFLQAPEPSKRDEKQEEVAITSRSFTSEQGIKETTVENVKNTTIPQEIKVEAGKSKRLVGRKKQIDDLLKKGAEAFDLKRLALQEHDSAYKYYRKIIEIDPKNKVAKSRLKQIRKRYVELAKQAFAKDNFSNAAAYIRIGLAISPENSELLSLQHKVVTKKQRLITEYHEKARQALRENNLTAPEDDCAYKYFKDIAKIDESNPIPQKGFTEIGDRYAVVAQEAYLNLNLSKARTLMEKGLAVDPRHKALLKLKVDLTQSIPNIFLDSLKKSVNNIIE